MNHLRSLSGVQWRDWDFNCNCAQLSTDPSNETFIMKAPNNSLNNSILIRWSSNYEVQKPRMEILKRCLVSAAIPPPNRDELRVLNGESPMKILQIPTGSSIWPHWHTCRPGCHKSGLKFSIAIRKELLSKHRLVLVAFIIGGIKSPAPKVGGVVLWSVWGFQFVRFGKSLDFKTWTFFNEEEHFRSKCRFLDALKVHRDDLLAMAQFLKVCNWSWILKFAFQKFEIKSLKFKLTSDQQEVWPQDSC